MRGAPAPSPDLIIGAGSACQSRLLIAKKIYGGKTIYFMRPSLPVSWFDVCVIPRHDSPPDRDNVIVSEGVLNDLPAPQGKINARGMILIGGPSKHHAWDTPNLVQQVKTVVRESYPIRYTLSGSRRTPADSLDQLKTVDGLDYVSLDDTSPQWLPDKLASATNVWVTADSVSMIYEALSCGARVGILAVPEKRDDRITSVSKGLIAREFATSFNQWCATKTLKNSPLLRESDRVAKLISERFALNAEARP